jgi:hypothetical protein
MDGWVGGLNKHTRIQLHILKDDLADKRREPGGREEPKILDALVSVRQDNGSKCVRSGEFVQSVVSFTKS